ncbi:hypothetical protein GCM10007962_28790 [Yeosuana aromativorans]|uniref:Uncharacterized protein n=1 Tax=Yeosuana aromativorans TaxID=288019 RepID=A0A8J3BR36_9FLAO|nr:hypothetical protein GCM10007962_28790 [Yeosuana aromativorans]
MNISNRAKITISSVIAGLLTHFFSDFLLTISSLYFVNKYALKNFDFLKFFSSISDLHTI